jgi:hypothetical protein
MRKFDAILDSYLVEFNIQDRNDPTFYDYVVVLLQQIKQRDLVDPDQLTDIRKTATETVKRGFYIFTDADESHNVALKIEFLFDGSGSTPNNLKVQITDLLNLNQKPKIIDNTFEEASISEITDYIEDKKIEQQEGTAGETAPEEVGETPSELPGAMSSNKNEESNTQSSENQKPQKPQTPNTSQYLKGLS